MDILQIFQDSAWSNKIISVENKRINFFIPIVYDGNDKDEICHHSNGTKTNMDSPPPWVSQDQSRVFLFQLCGHRDLIWRSPIHAECGLVITTPPQRDLKKKIQLCDCNKGGLTWSEKNIVWENESKEYHLIYV